MTDDRWLTRVVTALREREAPAVDLTPRILHRIRADAPRRTAGSRWIWAASCLAAAAAALLVLARPRPEPRPAGRVPSPRGKAIAFAIEAGSASRVSVVGDFNNWDRSGTPMTKDGAGEWHAVLSLPVGIYRYAFLVDDARWIPDPAHAMLVDHDFDQPTSVVTVQ